jgi:uncharacterized GH25 family protein
MNSLVKAALLSVAVFVVIIVSVIFLSQMREEGPLQSQDEDPVARVATQEASTPALVRDAEPLKPIPPQDAVKLTVEVLGKARGRRLQGSRLVISHLTEGDRAGERIRDLGSRDSSGLFEVDLAPGVYNVRVSCRRYKGESRSLALLEGTPQTLVFKLGRGNSISGRVVSSSGGAIAGARVLALKELASADADLEEMLIGMIEIQDMTGEFAAEDVSAEDGTYQLEGLEFKSYAVRAVATGYAPNEVDGVPAPRAEVNVVLTPGGSVSGVVQDASGLGVEGAIVSAFQELDSQNVFKIIISKARPPVDSATSDSAGRFQFDTLGPGIYNFRIAAKGYQTSEEVKKRVADGTTLSFSVQAGLVLRGFVSGPDGEPVPGAKVRASQVGAAAAQKRREQVSLQFDRDALETDAQGEFVLDTLAEGAYMLLCWQTDGDYATLRRNDVHVRPGMDPLHLQLDRGGRIRGKVLDEATGDPIAGARISANDVADLRKEAVSGEHGSFVLRGLATAGRSVMVSVNAPDYGRGKRQIKVQRNQDQEEIFELTPTGVVLGRVVNSVGDAIPGARVMAKQTQEASGVEQTLATDVSDRDGKFSLSGIDAGENRWIRVKKSQYLDGHSETFTLDPSQSTEVGDITLELGATLKGTVLGADGKGVRDCQVIIALEGQTDLQYGGNPSNHTNANGDFVIGGLNSGMVDVVVKASHFLEKRVNGIKMIEGQQFILDPIHLEQGSSVNGRVVNTRGEPVSNAEVVARDYSQGAKEIRTATTADGTFSVENVLAEDFIEIAVTHTNFGDYSNDKVSVAGPELEVVLKEYGRLRGIVVDPDGQPVMSFAVHPQKAEGSGGRRKGLKPQTFSPPDGAFEYMGVPNGDYTIAIRAPAYAAVSIPVTIGEGQVFDLGEIELQTGGIVSGTVIDSVDGAPLRGASVQVVQGSSKFLKDAGSTAGGGDPLQKTDADGNFAFARLKSGPLTLRVSQPGYVTKKEEKVNPDSGADARNLIIELDQSGEIRGLVVDSDNKAMVSMSVFLMGAKAGGNQRTQTDRQGKFRFSGVGAGGYTLKAHQFGKGNAAAVQAEKSVEMDPGQRMDVRLQLE